MSSLCDVCENLSATRQNRSLLSTLEKSSRNGCDACALLYNGVSLALNTWHADTISESSQRDGLDIRWWRTVSRKEFEFKIVKLEPQGSHTVLSTFAVHTAPGVEAKWTAIG